MTFEKQNWPSNKPNKPSPQKIGYQKALKTYYLAIWKNIWFEIDFYDL